jgi:outer membrane protein OmpA-like peptidoglycan-associated protein
MSRDPRVRRWARTAAGLTLAMTGGLVAGAPVAGAAPHQADSDENVRELEYRSRELTYRSRALDNSERVEESPEETSIVLAADVLFEFDRADLTPAANARLEELANQLADLGPRQVTIGGHTDSHGDTAYNQDLSERRAESVRAALDQRLDGDFTFEVTGHGETEPVAPNELEDGSDNPEGRALNRRVEITFPS